MPLEQQEISPSVALPSPFKGPDLPVGLPSRQLQLYKALLDTHETLGEMYLAGITVLHLQVPDAKALAAHAFREVMEKLCYYVDVPLKADKERLGLKVHRLQSAWNTAREKSCCWYQRESWHGEIDGPLQSFLSDIDETLRWFQDHFPRRRAEATKALRRMGGSPGVLPQTVEDREVKHWMDTKSYFGDVAHHRRVDLQEFERHQSELEALLLRKLRPRTFDEQSTIDAILEEARRSSR